LVAVSGFDPISGDPLPVRRNNPPYSADPNKIVSVIVPGPISWNPLWIAFGFLFWGNLVDCFRGRFGYYNAWLGIIGNRFCKSFVYGSVGKYIYPFFSICRLFLGMCIA